VLNRSNRESNLRSCRDDGTESDNGTGGSDECSDSRTGRDRGSRSYYRGSGDDPAYPVHPGGGNARGHGGKHQPGDAVSSVRVDTGGDRRGIGQRGERHRIGA